MSPAERFFTLSVDPLLLLGEDGSLRRVNPAFEGATGWPAASVEGRPLLDLLHPDDHGRWREAWDGLRAGHALDGYPLPLRRHDGSYLRLAWSVAPPDERGHVHAVARERTVCEDVGRALRESEARYAHISANVPGMVYQFVYGADGSAGYTFVSEGVRAMFGVDPRDALRDSSALVGLIHPDERDRFVRLARAAAVALGPFSWEGRVVLAGGEERFVQLAARGHRRPDGSVVSDGLLMDVTETRRAALRLEESEQRYRSLFDHNPDAVYSLDAEGRFVSANAACTRLSGYLPEELLGRAFDPLVDPEQLPAVRACFLQATAGSATRFEATIRHRSGRRVELGVTNLPIVVGGRVVGVYGVAKDLTPQRELADRLRQAQKMEAVGQLAGGVAHDFNNLLMVIQGFGAFVADALPDDGEARADLAEMLSAAARAQELTRQLLAFGRKQVLRPQRLDVNRTVTNVAGMLRRVIGEDIALETALAPAARAVVADPGQVEQVLMNLAVNARDAMPNGGTLRLRTANVADAEGPRVALVVEDTGVGIEPEVLAHIFEPFYTTKGVGLGTGLGLATVYGIVQQSGGTVAVDSVPGRGSRFTVLLPAAEAPEEARPSRRAASAPAGAETILLVEDEATVRSVARRMLERLGYTVHSAATGAEALRAAEAAGGEIDLLLTDLVMPEQSGRELAERLTARRPALRVLYMSGYTDDEIVRRGIAEADAAFLGKPFTAERLARAVRQALDAPALAVTAG